MKSCLFCGDRRLSSEHIWGKWLIRMSGVKSLPHSKMAHHVKESQTEISGRRGEPPRVHSGPSEIRRGNFSRNGTALHARWRLVCKRCNNTWMSNIENQMREVMRASIERGAFDLEPRTRDKIANWCALKGAMMFSAVTANSTQFGSASHTLRADYSFLRAGKLSPNWAVAMCQFEPPFHWGGHNLVYEQMHLLQYGNIYIPRPSPARFNMIGEVGPLGFWVTTSKRASDRLIRLTQASPERYALLAGGNGGEELSMTLKNSERACLEDVLYEISGRPKNFERLTHPE